MAGSRRLPVLKVDGGALLFDRLLLAPHEIEQKKATAAGIVRAYNLIGYKAVGVGSLDLAGGVDFLKQLAADSDFAWLSANLVERSDGQPIFKPSLSLDLGGVRVALVGLTDNRARAAGVLGDGAEIRPWRDVLPPLLAALSPNHEFIVLLTDLSPVDCLDLVRQLPQIDLIINASEENLNHPPRLLTSEAIMTSTDKQGRNIGVLEVFWNNGGKWSQGENFYLSLQEKEVDLAKSRNQIEQLRKSPEMVSRVGNLERRAEVLEVELADLSEKLGVTPDSFFSHIFYSMTPEVGDDPEVLAVVEETKTAVSALSGEKMTRYAAGKSFWPPGYGGGAACGECHPQAMAKWRQTKHAAAYPTLIRKNRQFDFDCLPCHVTGINYSNVDKSLVLAPELRGVGCEDCHGPGHSHAENPAIALPPVTANVCLHCHVQEHDDNFDFVDDVRKIKCNR